MPPYCYCCVAGKNLPLHTTYCRGRHAVVCCCVFVSVVLLCCVCRGFGVIIQHIPKLAHDHKDCPSPGATFKEEHGQLGADAGRDNAICCNATAICCGHSVQACRSEWFGRDVTVYFIISVLFLPCNVDPLLRFWVRCRNLLQYLQYPFFRPR